MGTGPRWSPVHRVQRPADRPRAALAARRPLADGVDERDLRGDPGRDLPQRRAADDRRHDDDRHPDRVHHAAEPAVPAADGAAQRRRPGGQLAGPVRADLRVPRPARRGRRARRPGRRRPVDGARRTSASRASGSPTPAPTYRLSTASTSTSPPARRSRWSARPARARARSPRSSPGCTTRRGAGHHRRHRPARLRLADLAEIVGVVSQETYLLHATVRENLRYAQPGRHRRRDRGRRARRPDPRPARLAARGLRHRGRLARAPVLRRGEAAARDRPHPAARPADAGPRRGDQRARHRDRAGRAAGLRHPGRGPHDDHHRAPALDRPRRRPDRRPRPRPGRSSRARTTRCSPTRAGTPRSPPDLFRHARW